MPFLPEDYKAPADGGNYYKFRQGENTFRILSPAIVGYEYWNKEKRPVRSKTIWKDIPDDADTTDGWNPKHFWSFIVWDSEAQKAKILQVTQKTIMAAIKSLVDNKKWGDPKGYDITVTRTGEGMDTEYSVVPNPHSDLPHADITGIRLEALFDNADPFDKDHSSSLDPAWRKKKK